MPQICEICRDEFGRVATNHTTLSHVKDTLSDTIEAFERHDYNHGTQNTYAQELLKNISTLEDKIRSLNNGNLA